MATEINGAAATRELEIKEKVEVVQEPGDHYDGEIPQLVPMERSPADLKKMEQSQENVTIFVRKPAFSLVRERNNLWKVQNQNLKLLESVTLRLADIPKRGEKINLWQ